MVQNMKKVFAAALFLGAVLLPSPASAQDCDRETCGGGGGTIRPCWVHSGYGGTTVVCPK